MRKSSQIASVGLTEAWDKEGVRQGGRALFVGNGEVIAPCGPDSMIKTIFDAETGQLLGAHMVGT